MKRNTLTVIISVKIIFRVSKELLKRFLNIYGLLPNFEILSLFLLKRKAPVLKSNY